MNSYVAWAGAPFMTAPEEARYAVVKKTAEINTPGPASLLVLVEWSPTYA